MMYCEGITVFGDRCRNPLRPFLMPCGDHFHLRIVCLCGYELEDAMPIYF